MFVLKACRSPLGSGTKVKWPLQAHPPGPYGSIRFREGISSKQGLVHDFQEPLAILNPSDRRCCKSFFFVFSKLHNRKYDNSDAQRGWFSVAILPYSRLPMTSLQIKLLYYIPEGNSVSKIAKYLHSSPSEMCLCA
jgi:hypothetical protein